MSRSRREVFPEALRWVSESVGAGSRITSIRHLRPGSWHVNHAVDVLDSRGEVHQLVLRRWARPGWELSDPDFTAKREAVVLTLLADSRVPAPRLVGADLEGAACGVPTLLTTRLPGRPSSRPRDMRSFLTQLAAILPEIHSVDGRARATVPPYRRYYEPDRLTLPTWLPPSSVWERAFEVARAPAPEGPACFIHRDYHPGNTLWVRGQLTGVVDWTQASWGHASVDLGHMRWNLAVDFGLEAADRFLAIHQAATANAVEHHPYWDMVTAVDHVADVDSLPRREVIRLEQYVEAALGHL